MDAPREGVSRTRQPVGSLVELDRAVDGLARVVSGIACNQREIPVPKMGTDVESVALRAILGLRCFVAIGLGREVSSCTGPPVDAEQMGTEYRHAVEQVRSVWHEPGALGSDYDTPWGRSSGAALVDLVLLEQLSCCRELERATGQARDVERDSAG